MKKFLFLFLITLGFFSCKNNELDKIIQTKVSLSFSFPKGMQPTVIKNAMLSLRNINTGKVETLPLSEIPNNNYSFYIKEGFYDFSFEGEIKEGGEVFKAKAYKEAIVLTGTSVVEVPMTLFLSKIKADFVIGEIFFTGTLNPKGKQYYGDAYFRFFNNSDKVLYADGLVLLEADFLTVSKRNYTPDIMSEAMAVQALYRIPGKGTDYPVEPGKSILICDIAIDHRTRNPNSFDLSKADFEWWDDSPHPVYFDVDNPEVPNLEKIFCYTKTIWIPHNRGFSSYAIGRIPKEIDDKTYLTDYTYYYDYDLVTTSGTYPMSNHSFRFPNGWIVDAVNLSAVNEFEWIVTDPSLDQGYAYVSFIDHDKQRYGKCVRRKIHSINPDGRIILKDTNNSSVDFDMALLAKPYYFK